MANPKKHILIVEDAPDIQGLLHQLFETEGYQVSLASNGQEALELLNTFVNLPTLILLDLMMPVMNGFEFLDAFELNDRISSIPVVVMTAYAASELNKKKLSNRELLTKPIDIDRLLSTAEKYCK